MINTEEFSRPLNRLEVNTFLFTGNDRQIEEFVFYYPYFNDDNNNKLYIKYIKGIDLTHTSVRLESAITLASFINFCDKRLLDLIHQILVSRRGFFLKLACLDYMLESVDRIKVAEYESLNTIVSKSKNEFLKLQSNLNLLAVRNDDQNRQNIIEALQISPYPNIFYRLTNSINANPIHFKTHVDANFLNEIHTVFKSKKFSRKHNLEFTELINNIFN